MISGNGSICRAPSIHRIPARQKQQGHPQQAQAEAVESLGFAGLLQKCPVEFIRLVERGVKCPLFLGVLGWCHCDEHHQLCQLIGWNALLKDLPNQILALHLGLCRKGI